MEIKICEWELKHSTILHILYSVNIPGDFITCNSDKTCSNRTKQQKNTSKTETQTKQVNKKRTNWQGDMSIICQFGSSALTIILDWFITLKAASIAQLPNRPKNQYISFARARPFIFPFYYFFVFFFRVVVCCFVDQIDTHDPFVDAELWFLYFGSKYYFFCTRGRGPSAQRGDAELRVVLPLFLYTTIAINFALWCGLSRV